MHIRKNGTYVNEKVNPGMHNAGAFWKCKILDIKLVTNQLFY